MSGHSKWANIKHRKGAADKKRGAMFTKLSKELMVAARLGGSDPDSNSRLRIAMIKARAVNMPNDTIERAVKKGAGELEGVSYEEVVYEIYGPNGIGVIVEALTDKKSRTTPEIKSLLNKHNWSLAESNAVSRLFQLRGYIAIEGGSIEEDALMEMVLDAGAEDMKFENGVFEIFTAPDTYSAVSEKIAEKKLPTLESGIQYLPLEGTEITVSDVETVKKVQKVLDLLEENDDVQAVYNNMELSEEVAAALEESV